MAANDLTASQWVRALESGGASVHRVLSDVYGGGADVLAVRRKLLERALVAFIARFGDGPARVFRAPARINLRGMHVDTHGGYLNLMTHQRETVLIARGRTDSTCTFANIEPEFGECTFDVEKESGEDAFRLPWRQFIVSEETRSLVETRKGGWENYVLGAVLRARCQDRKRPFRGFDALVASDIPRGAALSSSHALAVVTLSAALALNGTRLAPEQLILATQDAEWFTGARTGTSDQGAMILGGRGEFVNVALYADDMDLSGLRRIPFPDALRVLVINSHTRRSLSGAQFVAYTRNRFAYSLALDILRQELVRDGWAIEEVSRFDRMSRLTPDELGGRKKLYALLCRIPAEASIANLHDRYELPHFDEAYARYFGGVPEEERPKTIGLRGPLLFGLAESERARRFGDLMFSADYVGAGRLMTAGHDGDRVVNADGSPHLRRADDEYLRQCEEEFRSIAHCPGDYGASRPALDALVDAALSGGALGASLTGAGIAGAVLALCRVEDADRVTESVRARLGQADYHILAHRNEPLSEEEIKGSVTINTAIAGVGELTWGD